MPTLVQQSPSLNDTTSGSVAAIFNSPTTVGNCVILSLASIGTADSIASVSSSIGTFTRVVANDPGGSYFSSEFWICESATGASQDVTVTTTSGTDYVCEGVEWLGSASAVPTTAVAHAETTAASVSITPHASGDLILAALTVSAAPSASPSSPWTNFTATGVDPLFGVAWQTASSTSAVTASWTVGSFRFWTVTAIDVAFASDALVTTSDTLLSSESVTRSAQHLSRVISDTLVSSESTSRSAEVFIRATSDTLLSSESVTGATGQAVTTSDTLLSSESVTRASQHLIRSTSDILLSSESTSRSAIHWVRTTSDTLLVSESTTRSAYNFHRSTSDTLLASESVYRAAIAWIRSTSDPLFSSETTTRGTQDFIRSTADTLFSSEGLVGAYSRTTSDTLLTAESTYYFPGFTATATIGVQTTAVSVRGIVTQALVQDSQATVATVKDGVGTLATASNNQVTLAKIS